MSLIFCSECGKEYSDKATACPNCGCPTEIVHEVTAEASEALNEAMEVESVNVPSEKSKKWLWVMLGGVVLAGVIALVCYIQGQKNNSGIDLSYSSESGIKSGNGKLSLSERKEAVELAAIRRIVLNADNSGKFYKVDWMNTRYRAEIKQTSEWRYTISLSLSLYDKYENLLATSKPGEIYGDVTMTEEGVVQSMSLYGYGRESCYQWK